MAKEIIIDHVFKVFGKDPKAELELVRQGCIKEDILPVQVPRLAI